MIDRPPIDEACEQRPAESGVAALAKPFALPRTIIGMVFGLAAAIGVVLLLHPQLVHDVAQIRPAATNPAYFLLIFVAVLTYLAADSETMTQLVRVLSPSCRRRPLYLVTLRSAAIGGATSFGGVEMPYQVLALRGIVGGLAEATSTVVVKAVVHASVLVLIAVVALLPIAGSPVIGFARWSVLGVLGVIVVAWLIGSLWVRRPIGLARLPERVRTRLTSLRDAFAQFHGAGLWRIIRVSMLQLVYWGAMLSIAPLALYALGWRGPIVPVVLGQAVVQLLMPLSPLPGGAGVAELGYLALIGHSLPGGLAVASLIVWRLATWGLPMLIGFVSFGVPGGPEVYWVKRVRASGWRRGGGGSE